MATTWKVKSCWNHLVYLKGISKRKSMVNFAAKVWLQVHFWLLSRHVLSWDLFGVFLVRSHYFITSSLPSFRNSHTFFWSSIPVLAIKWWTCSLGTSVGMLQALVQRLPGYRLFSTSISTVESHLSDLGENRVDEKNVLKFSIATKHPSFILWIQHVKSHVTLHVRHKQKLQAPRSWPSTP